MLELLSAIYTSSVPITPQPLSERARQQLVDSGQKQTKAAKIEEWKGLPLVTLEDRHRWWLTRSEITSRPASSIPSFPSLVQQETWNEASPAPNRGEDSAHTARVPSIPIWPTSLDPMINGTMTPDISGQQITQDTPLFTMDGEIDTVTVDETLTTNRMRSSDPEPRTMNDEKWRRRYF